MSLPTDKKFFTIRKASSLLNISPDTLRRLEAKGKIKPRRGANNERLYSLDDILLLREISRKSALNQKTYSIKEAANLLNVSSQTIRRWEREGKIKVKRTPGGHRCFTYKDIQTIKSDSFQPSIKREIQIPPQTSGRIIDSPILSLEQERIPFNLKLISFVLVSSLLIFIASYSREIGYLVNRITGIPVPGIPEEELVHVPEERDLLSILAAQKGIYEGDIGITGNVGIIGNLDVSLTTTTKDLVVSSSAKINKLSVSSGLVVAGNEIINSSGKIPAINGYYFEDLSGENLTNVNAHHLNGVAASSFLRSDQSDTAEGAINFTASPGSINVGGGPVYINPAASTANYTLFGIAVNASSRFRVDAEGDVFVNGDVQISGGDLTTDSTSFNLINTTAITLNIGSAATSISIGASTGTVTLNNDVSVSNDLSIGNNLSITGTSTFTGTTTITGDLSIEGNTTLGDATTDTLTFNPATLTWAGGDKTIDITGAGTRTLTLLNSTTDQIADLDLSDGSLKLGGTTRISNTGAGTFTDVTATRRGSFSHGANQGLNLPTNAGAPSAVTGTTEGDIAYDTSGDTLYIYDGASFTAIKGLFTDGGTTTYLTSTTDNLALGGTDSSAPFFMNVSTGNLTITGGLTAGSGSVDIVNSSGKIPAISSTYLTNLSGANLTSVDATTLDSTDSTSFLRSDTSDGFTSGTLSFSDGTFLDLSSVLHDDVALQGLRLPQNTSFSAPTSGEGFLAWDTDDNKLFAYNGSSWTEIGGGLFTDGGAVTYLTSQTDDVAFGGTDSSAPFFFNESAELLTLTNTTAGDSFRVNDVASDTTPFLIDADGKVGIGTTTPDGKLDVESSGIYLSEISAPGTPNSSKGVIYAKTDGRLYFKNDAGTEHDLTNGHTLFYADKSDQWVAASTWATVSWNEQQDPDNAFASSEYTAPSTGQYTIQILVHATTERDFRCVLQRDTGTGYADWIPFGTDMTTSSGAAGWYGTMTLGVTLDLTSGYKLRVRYYGWPGDTIKASSRLSIMKWTGAAGADLAEWYLTPNQNLVAGDILTADPNNGYPTDPDRVAECQKTSACVYKSSKAYDESAFAIYSFAPEKVLGDTDGATIGYNNVEIDKSKTSPIPVALAGRVPVKLWQGSEPIEPGDYITTSPEPGRGMKATKPGRVVGMALESWNPGEKNNRILVFVSPTHYEPPFELAISEETGNLTLNDEEVMLVEKDATASPEQATPSAKYTLQDGAGKFIEKLGAFTNLLVGNIKAGNMSVDELTIGNQKLTDYLKEYLVEINEDKTASMSARINNLEIELLLLKSSSLTTDIPEASSSSFLTSLTVLSDSVLGDTVINGKLNVGILSFDNLVGSIDAIGPLKLQSLTLGSIELAGGSIEIDQSGNLDIKKGVISGNDKFRGNAILTAGEIFVRVEKEWEEAPTSVTITPSYNTVVWVTDKSDRGFIVHVDKVPTEDQALDWLAIW